MSEPQIPAGESPPEWIKIYPKPTEEDVVAETREENQRCLKQMAGFRSNPLLIPDELLRLLAEFEVSGYTTNAACGCHIRLWRFVLSTTRLKSQYADIPVDIELLKRFCGRLDAYTDRYLPPYERNDRSWEEEFERYLNVLKASLPLLDDWAASKTGPLSVAEDATGATSIGELHDPVAHESVLNPDHARVTTSSITRHGPDKSESPFPSDGDSLGVPTADPATSIDRPALDLKGFAGAGDKVPREFRQNGEEHGDEIGPLFGTATDLLWQIDEHWSNKSGDLLIKHKHKVVFVRKIGEKRYAVFFQTYDALQKAKLRGPRPDKNPKPRKKRAPKA